MLNILLYLATHCQFQTVRQFVNRAGDQAWTWLPVTIFVVYP